MKIIDNKGAGISYKAMMEAYLEGVVGGIEPTCMYMSQAVFGQIAEKLRDIAWGQSHLEGFQILRFMNAQFYLAEQPEDSIGNSIWYMNPKYPTLSVILINIGVD